MAGGNECQAQILEILERMRGRPEAEVARAIAGLMQAEKLAESLPPRHAVGGIITPQ